MKKDQNTLNLLTQVSNFRRKILQKKMDIYELGNYIDTVFIPLRDLLLESIYEKEDFVDFLYLCLDYYTFTEHVLISDHEYDLVMNRYLECGGERIIYADPIIGEARWKLVKHEAPGMVGSVSKIYEEDELEAYWNKYRRVRTWMIAPKYDGISACIKVKKGRIALACTRYDGVMGQDITDVVRNASNVKEFLNEFGAYDGYHKVELCVSSSDFKSLSAEKTYSNRRSATSGIVSFPKNLQYAKYVSIIPLAADCSNMFVYHPKNAWMVDNVGSWSMLHQLIEEMLQKCRMADFEYRTDGVVIFPLDPMMEINREDVMSDAIAFKVNTEVGLTRIKNLYVSVGRMGKAIPMAEVIPVEVNETMVTDVSLGSFDKAVGMTLHEDETVEVYSAGNVIPQIRLPEIKTYPKHSERVQIPMHCPYCGVKLTRHGREWFCENESCERVLTGKITNFIYKLGVMNVSDATVEDLYRAKLIHTYSDIFNLREEDIAKIEGYGDLSASLIVNEIKKIKDHPIPMDVFFGALGIPDIGEKTARKIFSVIEVEDIQKKKDKLFMRLINADGIGEKKARAFVDFVKENQEIIEDLMNVLTIATPIQWKGNIVFTGFRDPELQLRFNKMGYEVSDNVTSQTAAVITNSRDFSSGKCKAANRKGIDIVFITEVESLIRDLKQREKESIYD